MHCVEAALDAGDVFTMLAEQQLQSALGARERSRALIAATEGPGVVGVLAMQIADELGVIESSSRARIITTEQETMIAQVTVTALKNSPVNRAGVWLTVRPGTASDSVSSGPRRGGVPATGMRGDH
ncbi:MAG: hypothetical protein P4L86_28910 [Mycobacterium sp.]|nr:hypothetical protein [Mycobacterium sp.]